MPLVTQTHTINTISRMQRKLSIEIKIICVEVIDLEEESVVTLLVGIVEGSDGTIGMMGAGSGIGVFEGLAV